MLKLIPILLLALILSACSKEDKTTQNNNTPSSQNNSNDESNENLTKEEVFSSTLVQDIAGVENEALEIYLEEVIYPIVSKSNKVTLDKISGSLYLLSYDDNGTIKNLMIQEYYSPAKDEMVFDKTETQTNAIKQFVK
jgi:PBP1b-binding outer membrane lipoprotein LpoB